MAHHSSGIKKTKHRILIEAYKFGTTGHIDGSARYINSLLNGIYIESNDEVEIFLLLNRKIIRLKEAMKDIQTSKTSPPSALSRIRIKANRYFEQFDIIRKTVFLIKSYLFFKQIKSYQFDIVHILLPHRYYLMRGSLTDTILVMSVLDLTCKTVPQFHLDANTKTTWAGIVYSYKFCDGIICISENTKRDFLKYFPNYSGMLTVTHLGFDDKIFFKEYDLNRVEDVKRKYDINSGYYILSLFTLEPRKNLRNLILAFELLRQTSNYNDVELVIAGKVGWRMDEDLKLIGDAVGINLIGYVDEADLASIYSGATAFCYPSFYEGFGLPLLEAMACGTPVIYGNNSSMPEVVGNAGLSCEPDSPKDIMLQIQKICVDDDLRSNLSRASLKRAQQFSWAKCAQETLKVYDKLLSKESGLQEAES